MGNSINLGDIAIDVVHKDIKNIHLSVYPPNGHVRISAPMRMDLDNIRLYALSKLEWIKKQQRKIQEQDRETKREFVDRESHYAWGERYLLQVIENKSSPTIILKPGKMTMQVRPGSSESRRRNILADWYRGQVRSVAAPIIEKWEARLGVKVHRLYVRQMKTKWGSCNPDRSNIRLNTELAKKPPECLEYIAVHEMMHLIERTHNSRFISLMDQFMPRWRICRDLLNQLPVRHEEWHY